MPRLSCGKVVRHANGGVGGLNEMCTCGGCEKFSIFLRWMRKTIGSYGINISLTQPQHILTSVRSYRLPREQYLYQTATSRSLYHPHKKFPCQPTVENVNVRDISYHLISLRTCSLVLPRFPRSNSVASTNPFTSVGLLGGVSAQCIIRHANPCWFRTTRALFVDSTALQPHSKLGLSTTIFRVPCCTPWRTLSFLPSFPRHKCPGSSETLTRVCRYFCSNYPHFFSNQSRRLPVYVFGTTKREAWIRASVQKQS